jgi:hypothetical protein
MGKLYCICNDASKNHCKKCEKRKQIKPDHTLYCPTWKKIIINNPRKKLYE